MFSNHSYSQNCSFYETLDYYGYQTIEQKDALERLMHLAEIIPAEKTLKSHYPNSENSDKLLEYILDFVHQTQKHFTIRSGTQERWDVLSTEWMKNNDSEIQEMFRKLGICNKISLRFEDTDVICILGATNNTMKTRVNYAQKLFVDHNLKPKYLVLLAGERSVSTKTDGSLKELSEVAKKYNISDLNKLTETHLLQYLYENSQLYNKLPVHIIDTPKGNLPRPTTATTIEEMIKWLDSHREVSKITFVSSQPYVGYQEAVIAQILQSKNINVKFEVVCEICKEDSSTVSLLEALGSYVWAKTPLVIQKLNLDTSNTFIIDDFKKTYIKNPFIYSNIESLFNVAK
jgi:hypothetical protein